LTEKVLIFEYKKIGHHFGEIIPTTTNPSSSLVIHVNCIFKISTLYSFY